MRLRCCTYLTRLATNRPTTAAIHALAVSAIGAGLLVTSHLKTVDAGALPNAVLVIDGSASMAQKLSGRSKVSITRKALRSVLTKYHGQINLGLMAYGRRKAQACDDIHGIVKLRPLRSTRFANVVDQIGARGMSPIAATLIEAEKFVGLSKSRSADFIFIADGGENCFGNPCANAARMKSISPRSRIHVIALGSRKDKTLAGLSCMAQKTGGTMSYASNTASLESALDKVFSSFAKPRAGISATATQQNQKETSQQSQKETASTQPSSQKVTETGDTAIAQQSLARAAQQKQQDTERALEKLAAETMPNEKLLTPPDSNHENSAQTRSAKGGKAGTVKMYARLIEGAERITSGMVWRIFTPVAGRINRYSLIATHREAAATVKLPPGVYLINGAYGRAHLTQKVTVEANSVSENEFVLNAGGLRLGAVLANNIPLPENTVSYKIFADERDQFGKRQLIMRDARPGVVIRLNAGLYHVVSTYGSANATVGVDVTVEAGKLTDAKINHAAAKVTFRLVRQPGGEALANVRWNILSSTGDIIMESAGALPVHILAAGKYTVVARHQGSNFTRLFTRDSRPAHASRSDHAVGLSYVSFFPGTHGKRRPKK